jgi:hypothetical protein
MKQELLTLLAVSIFALSLAGTSKAPPSEEGGSPPTSSRAGSSKGRGSSAKLPDTAAWKPYSFAPGKITAKTPPGAKVTCTKTGEIVVCVVLRGTKLLGSFGAGGSSFDEIAADIKKSPKVKILHEAPNELVVHRDDEKFGSFCEYVAQVPDSDLRSVFALASGVDATSFKAIALQDSDCLDAIAFARTLRQGP